MKNAVKSILVSAWLLITYLLGQLPATESVMGWVDWSQLGWAFAGSTVFVLWEFLQKPPVHRTGWERAALILIGLIVSLAATGYVSAKLGLPTELCTTALGAGGYKFLTFFQKKVDKSEESLSDLTDLNDKKP